MQYMVYASPQAAFDAVRTEPDWDALSSQYGFGNVDYMKASWKSYNAKWNGGTFEKVESEFHGDHAYEAGLMFHVEQELKSADFFKKRFVFQDRLTCGQRVNVGRYLAGDARCWSSVRRKATKNFAIRVFAPMGGLGVVSAKEMRVCGALTCAVVEAIEQNGICTEVWASCECAHVLGCRTGITLGEREANGLCGSGWDDVCTLVKIKDSSEYTDYGMLNYITGNNGFYRNIVFKTRVLCGVNLLPLGGKFTFMGASRNFDRENIPPDEAFDSSLDIVLPRIYEIEEAKKYLANDFIKQFDKIQERKIGNEQGD